MEQNISTYKKIEQLLEKDYRILEDLGYNPPEKEEKYSLYNAIMESYQGELICELAAACQCFYLFRKLHLLSDKQPESSTLLGDYFFSRFSQYLIPLDSTELIERFSDFLKDDSLNQTELQNDFSRENYIAFIKDISLQLNKTWR